MVRTRLTALTAAVGLAFVSGCAELSCHSLFGRRGACCTPGCESCCEAGCGGMPFEGPVLEGSAPFAGQPAYPAAPAAPGAPETMPQLSAPPRLVPTPQQAQPAPYTPSYRSRTVSQSP